MSFKRFAAPAALIALVILVFGAGCAPPVARGSLPSDPNAFFASIVSNGITGSSANGINASQWTCPNSPNILPEGYDNTNMSERFTVCSSTTNAAQFLISGTTNLASLCVYPLDSASGSISLVEQPQCFSVGSSNVTLTFNSQSINYMAIVNSNFTNQMTSCLSGPAPCPAHSEGFVE